MAANHAKAAKRTVEDDGFDRAHGLAAALQCVGAMDDLSVQGMDRRCLRPRSNGN